MCVCVCVSVRACVCVTVTEWPKSIAAGGAVALHRKLK